MGQNYTEKYHYVQSHDFMELFMLIHHLSVPLVEVFVVLFIYLL